MCVWEATAAYPKESNHSSNCECGESLANCDSKPQNLHEECGGGGGGGGARARARARACVCPSVSVHDFFLGSLCVAPIFSFEGIKNFLIWLDLIHTSCV